MRVNSIILRNGLIAGGLLIAVHYLGNILHYMAGLLIPVVYVLLLIWTVISARKANPELNLIQLFLISFIVFAIASIINHVFIILSGQKLGEGGENIEAMLLLLLIGLVVSFIVPWVILLIRRVKNK